MDKTNALNHLNEQQREVVTAASGHLAVIAGAGTGKTGVLVHRIAWLLENANIFASQILAVTFTNKAAAEMRERIEQLTHMSARAMWIGTFHGIAHRLLRLHWQLAGLPETFQILDSDDQLRLIKRIHKALNLDDEKWPPQQSQWYINAKKDEGLRVDAVVMGDHFDQILCKVYRRYEQQCAHSGLVDFAELLLRSYELLEQQPSVLQHYQQRFAHILVDEFQDTNDMQYRWLMLLAGSTARMMIVGDDDQSIYSWRGARIENLYTFNREFSPKLIRLEQNYRSTNTILAAANAVIAHNGNRFGKNLWTDIPGGDPLSLYMAFNETDEARFIVSTIKAARKEGASLKDMAILYRSNAQSRLLEEELLGANIPYRIYGGQKFFERAEIKDTLAYLRLMSNPHDDAAFERAVNVPPRGIGNTTLELVRDHARQANLSLWEASEAVTVAGKLTSRANNAVSGFLRLINKFCAELQTQPLPIQTQTVVNESGLFEYYNKDRSEKTQARLENIEELIQATHRYTVDDALALPPLQAFLSYVALESGDNQAQEYEDSVQLMTLHSAKGLEFNTVFLAGLEEGLFPHKMSMEERGLEEERRLCYVGMTRARQKLYLSYAESRFLNGTRTTRTMSRFVKEIPDDLLQDIRMRTRAVMPTTLSTTKVVHDTGLEYQLGDRVIHQNFGEGVVLNYEGQGAQARVQVKFRTQGTKWLMIEYAKLEKR